VKAAQFRPRPARALERGADRRGIGDVELGVRRARRLDALARRQRQGRAAALPCRARHEPARFRAHSDVAQVS
jgi:hypothetical protein